MRIQGNHVLNASAEQLWKLLVDPEVLRRCTPGCETLKLVEENTYEAVLNLGVGMIKGRYTGRIRLDEMQPPSHLKMVVEGKGAQGFVKGTGLLDLQEEGDGTTVAYTGDVQLGGPIASIGQRMVQSSSKLMAGQFFTAIETEVAAVKQAEVTRKPIVPPKHGILRNFLRYLWLVMKRMFGRDGRRADDQS